MPQQRQRGAGGVELGHLDGSGAALVHGAFHRRTVAAAAVVLVVADPPDQLLGPGVLLVDALVREDKQEWCLDTDDEDDSDDEGAVLPLAAASPSQLDAVAAAAE